MTRFIYSLSVLLAIGVSTPVFAASPYEDELRQLSGELRSLMIRADQAAAKNPGTRQELDESLFDLSKRLHRLQEEAMSANTELQRSGHPRDRGLTFAAAVAETLDLAQSHTSAYLETRDKSFSVAASAAARSARELMAAE